MTSPMESSSPSVQGVFWIRVAAVIGFVGVCMGTFMAHGIESMLKSQGVTDPAVVAQRKEWVETGVEYQMYHGLAMLAIGVIAAFSPRRSKALGWAASLFLVGILLFSGSLYALALTDYRKLGMIAPIGGLSFLAGWLTLAVAGLSQAGGSTRGLPQS